MTSHRNILANCRGAHRLLETLGLGDEVFLNFLPLSHSYEHTAGLMFPISLGAEIYFAEGAETLAANMLEARPTIMTAVPRLYETLHRRIISRGRAQGRSDADDVRQGRGDRAKAVGVAGAALRRAPPRSAARPPRAGEIAPALRRPAQGDGVGRRAAQPEIGSFFLALGVRLLQGYGQTEAAPVIACNSPTRIKIDTVGPPLDGVRVKIADDGEILVAGDNVMKGYWNDPEATARTLRRRLAQDRRCRPPR